MTIRTDLDIAYGQLRAVTGRPVPPGPRWRMSPGNRHALASDLGRREPPDSYLGIPIEVATDIRGWELVRA